VSRVFLVFSNQNLGQVQARKEGRGGGGVVGGVKKGNEKKLTHSQFSLSQFSSLSFF